MPEETKMAATGTLWFEAALLPDGWARDVRISNAGGLITQIETGISTPAGAARGRAALPGLANLHSHAFQRGMSGLTEARGEGEDSFWSWRDLLYRFVDKATPDQIGAITAMAYAEMLEAGFTRVAEFHYLHNAPDGARYDDPAEMAGHIAKSAMDTGIGLTLLPVFYAHSGFGGQAPLEGQKRFLSNVESYAQLLSAAKEHAAALPDAVTGVAPHSLRAVTPEELKAVIGMSADGPIHIHIAEQQKEVDDCLSWSSARPVEWLLANAAVDEHWCLVHATHTTESELQGIAASGAVAGLCPVTEANLGDGIFDGRAYLAHGGRFGVGSDSNVSICAADELRMLEYSQRLRYRQRSVLGGGDWPSTGRSLFEHALAGGHQACGSEGGLRVGVPADIIALDSSEAEDGADALLDAWVFRAGRSMIADVWRRGAPVVQAGRHIHRDAIRARYQSTLRQLLS